MRIRPANETDLHALLAIYNEAIRNSTAVYTEEEVDLANRQQWFRDRQASCYPVLVAENSKSGVIMGYASFGDFRAWPGYRYTVEHSVYVEQSFQRRGVAKALVSQLLDEARDMGKHVMIAGIDTDNYASLKLHENLGFEKAVILREVGRKFDRWLSLVLMQKIL